MERIPEPELMDEADQARAYAEADFSEPHDQFVALLRESFPGGLGKRVLDLGCGPADVTVRVARGFTECFVDGIDGAEAMLEHGRALIRRSRLESRIRLVRGYLPGDAPPEPPYDSVISNSLLHHLSDPAALWDAARSYGRPDARVFVMDLVRPESRKQAEQLVETYAKDEPEVLRRDFFLSLLAAYTVEEVDAQLARAGLGALKVRAVSDRHLVVDGRLSGQSAS